ncbi:TPA: rod shape-determining protein MreD [Streptococcus suis]|uniref:Rod shape-determining protein MreD n=1 Tax=Streptococcus suivaginalis TaxID=3028082 RepID=A0AA96VCA9_9STRE|nr:rod shape-determining protein MreD [Streptococcus sp. 29896]MBL6538871.1 rod shape-determining protein MreD [Streptococcus suis]MBM7315660.1 rod shape-determining protein MreD [Streptococcus suis]MCK4027640.1 rod shape-determining protein MreD [Streptococcus suis]WNY47170.1 rod shape-determining protein MreD [Streptococcus sp. 29896]HEL1587313.1 rod shape-determining protein MreD [Streptococcus suis]
MMKYRQLILFSPLILFVSFLLDGQITHLLGNFTPGIWLVSSQLFFIVALYTIPYFSMISLIAWFSFFGLLYDIYYFNILGMATCIFPLMAFFTAFLLEKIQFRWFSSLSLLVIWTFIFETSSFVLARLFGMTNLSVFIFIMYYLFPTLVFNSLLFVFLNPLLNRLFGITNKT